MANKYIRHGAAYCGDGTASNEAASNGAAGAWNNINVLHGTAPAYGTLAAGDTVFIRSKTSAGADIAITSASSGIYLGVTQGTESAPISWVLDGGTIWSGINGVLTITGTDIAAQILVRSNNQFAAQTKHNWVLRTTAGGNNYCVLINETFSRNVFDSLKIDISAGGSGYSALFGNNYSWLLFKDCQFVGGPVDNAAAFLQLHMAGSHTILLNCEIVLAGKRTGGVFSRLSAQGAFLQIIGGCLRGAGATTGTYLIDVSAEVFGTLELVGFKYPYDVGLAPTAFGNSAWHMPMRIFGSDGGVSGASRSYAALATSRQDGNFPTLNAAFPDSVATPWSLRVDPDFVSGALPWYQVFSKVFQGSPSALTVTVELLVATGITGANLGNTWINVDYVDDATGLAKSVSSRIPGSTVSLDTSSASWSATTYGSTSFNKRKLSAVTPTSVKKDTAVNVTICSSVKQGAATHILFVCPDPQFT